MSKELLKNLGVSVVAIILMAIVLEGGARLLFPQERARFQFPKDTVPPATLDLLANDYKRLGYELKPYVLFQTRANQQLHTIQINSLGLRDEEIQPKPDNVLRVVLLGGSTAFGWGATMQGATIAALLEQQLNRTATVPGKRFEVINAAQPAYITAQELALFQWYVLQLSPDLVITLDGNNDLSEALQTGKFDYPDGFPVVSVAYNQYVAFSPISVARYTAKMLLTKSRLLGKLYIVAFGAGGVGPQEATARVQDPSWFPSVQRSYQNNLESLVGIARARHIKVIVALQPMLGVGLKQLTDYEGETLKLKETRTGADWISFVPLAYEAFWGTLRDLSNGADVAALDLRGVFDGVSGTMFIDHIHLSDRGQELVAHALTSQVLAMYDESRPAVNTP